MGILDRSKLLAKAKFEIEKVVLGKDEKGEEIYVFVRQMSGYERDAFEQSLLTPIKNNKGVLTGYEQNMNNFRAKLAVQTVCDEEGNNILQPGDFEQLSKNMTAKMLEMIIEVAQKLNKISDEDKEELIKNSEAAQGGNSTSGFVKS